MVEPKEIAMRELQVVLNTYFSEKDRLKIMAKDLTEKKRATINVQDLCDYTYSLEIDIWEEMKKNEEIIDMIFNCLLDNDTFKLVLTSFIFPKKKEIKKDDLRGIITFENLPDDVKVNIEDCFLPKSGGRLIEVEGIIQYISSPESVSIYREMACKCGHVIKGEGLIHEKKYSPTKKMYCPNCSSERYFKETVNIFKAIQILKISETFQAVTVPTSLIIVLQDHLLDETDPFKKKILPGKSIRVLGIVKHTGSVKKKTMVNALNLDIMGDIKIDITSDDEKWIKEFSKKENAIEELVNSFIPEIVGLRHIKESILLSLIGGNERLKKGGVYRRGVIHQLWVGEPSTAKSTISDFLIRKIPRCINVTSGAITSVGLGLALEKDPDLGVWLVKGGALVHASNGLLLIDEFQGMSKEHIQDIKTSMSQQRVSLAKAGIVSNVKICTPIIGIMNPKGGYFDPYVPWIDQINLPKLEKAAMLQRFDLKWPIRDIVDEEKDKRIADSLLEREMKEPPIPIDMLTKYILYARRFKPVLNKDVSDEIKKYYLVLREKSKQGERNITPRVLETLRRLTEAIAKLRLKEEADTADFNEAKRLLVMSLKAWGYVPETGEISIPKSEGMVSQTMKGSIDTINVIFSELEKPFPSGEVPTEDLVSEIEKQTKLNPHKIKRILDKMKNEGWLFECRPGVLKRV